MEDYSAWPVRALKAELQARGVPCGDCTEKRELVERLRSSPSGARGAPAAAAAESSGAAPGARQPQDNVGPETSEVRRVLECSPTDYYRILQVSSSADADELKRAYRKLAIKLHPDKCNARGADEAFKRVGQAYTILSDPRKRTAHDWGGGGADGAGAAAGRGPMFGDQDAEELFRAFFGDPGGAGGPCAGGGRRGAGGSSVSPATATDIAERAAGLFARLSKTFAQNPWTLVTLLSGLASLVSFMETLTTLLGGWCIVAIPFAAIGLYKCPPDQRRNLGVLFGVLLCSGILF
ncbi:unnamed protein product [Prorocentrum cordatum]|uniref:J domain-containing protein n=1 Tax=Prorocentrum cordatum TaxID=2364126 RepID=A0ABN9R595_9DINO|nr:unnamed protein product [Polarella glacialis]